MSSSRQTQSSSGRVVKRAAGIAVAVAFVATSVGTSGPAGADTNEGVPGTPSGAASVIAAGDGQTCARLASGGVKCWGNGSDGQLGQGNTANIGDGVGDSVSDIDPIDLDTGRTATAITAGNGHTCALLDDATVKCWGGGGNGRLGQGNTDEIGNGPGEMGDNLPPVDLGAGRTATAVSAGGSHTCALLDDGTVKCWGRGQDGQLGQGDNDSIGGAAGEMGDDLAPIDLGTGRTATAITAGHRHTCALLDDRTVKCWGANVQGQLGQGSTTRIGASPNEMGDNLPPVDLGAGSTAAAITAGHQHTCAVLDNGSVKCWGDGNNGGLGQDSNQNIGDGVGDSVAETDPIDLGGGRTAVAVSAGEQFTCALLDDAGVKCWGNGNNGRLGQGDTASIGNGTGDSVAETDPIELQGAAIAITTGRYHACALLADFSVKCWGEGDQGKLGQDSTDDIGSSPNQMSNLDKIVLGAGGDATAVPVTVAPAGPTGASATAGAQSATVTWNAPGDNGGAAVSGYRIQSSSDGVVWTTAVTNTGTTATSRTITGLTAGQPIRFRVAAINTAGIGVWSPATNQVTPTTPADPTPTDPTDPSVEYVPLDPARLLDTRPGTSTIDGEFTPGVKLTGGEEIALQITGRPGIPTNADAAVLNVTVNEPELPGFITAYPCGTPRPEASNLNYVAGQTIPNTVITKLGDNGTICLFSDQTTHLIADINGIFPDTSTYTALDPARLLDTRPGTSTIDGLFIPGVKLTGGEEIALQITGRPGIPTNADAAVLNVTVNDPELPGFITAYPCGTPRPEASNLNYTTGQTIPNTVITKLGDNGTICLFSDQTTHLIADINGTFPTTSTYTALDPARLLDTRPGTSTIDGQFTPGVKLTGGEEIALHITGRPGIPGDVDAAVLNVTVNEPELPGFITAYPCGTPRPEASNLNYVAGQTIPNTVITKLGDNGTICLFSDQTTHLIADINGTFPD